MRFNGNKSIAYLSPRSRLSFTQDLRKINQYQYKELISNQKINEKMVVLKNNTRIEDIVKHANRSWKKTQLNIKNGNIDIESIVFTMGQLNYAHLEAIKQNRKDLLTANDNE